MSRLLKMIIAIAAAAVITVGLIVGLRIGRKSDGSDMIRIGVLVYKSNDTFISNMTEAIVEISNRYQSDTGMRTYISVSDAQESQSLQTEQIKRYIQLGYDVLCVNLVDRTDAASVIDIAREANIPVVFFHREPVREDMEKWDRIIYVGSDARETAELEGQIVLDFYRENPRLIDLNGDGIVQYIMLEGESRHQDALIRTEVSVQFLRDSGMQLEKIDGGIANWNRSQGAALTEQYFNEYNDEIELIICNNDDMALGATDTVSKLQNGFGNIVGIDGTPQGLDAVAAGKMLGTVVVDYEKQAQLIFNLSLALYEGREVSTAAVIEEDGSVRAPMYIEKRENL